MKKPLSVILAALIALSALSAAFSVSASAEVERGTITYDKDFQEEYADVINALASGIDNYESSINIYSYKFPKSLVGTLAKTVQYSHPELFYYDGSIGYSYSGDYINAVKPKYKEETPEEALRRKEKFETRAQWYVSKLDDSMTDFQKALTLHDELIINSEYILDTDVYDLMVEGRGKCYCYAGAYAYLLSLAGINSEQVISAAMNHQWNKIELDGKWYNVDVTWDDPTPNKECRVSHNYFLLSDEKIAKDKDNNDDHYGYTSAYESTDTYFDNAAYHSSDSRLCCIGEDIYFIDGTAKALSKYYPETNTTETIRSINDYWSAGEQGYWIGIFSTIDSDDDFIYFNTPSKIYTYDITNGTEEVFYENTNEHELYGLRIIDGEVWGATAEGANSAYVLFDAGKCKVRADRYKTSDGKKIMLNETFTREADDTTDFGIGNSFTNLKILGIQKKDNSSDEEQKRSVRFITVMNNEILKDAADYGFIAFAGDDLAKARETITPYTFATTPEKHVFSCAESSNNISGDYGVYSAEKKYKYVTFKVNNIGDYGVAVMFYVKDKKGNVFYAPYTNSDGDTFTNCALDWAALSY